MPFLPDPALRFSHPANRDVVAFLRCQAVRAEALSAEAEQTGDPAGSDRSGELDAPVTVDGFLLHTHAELCQRLCVACAGLPDPCKVSVYGVALLAARGIIFALAFGAGPGEDWLAVRLAAGDRLTSPAAHRAGVLPDIELGNDWLCLDPWPLAGSDGSAQDCLSTWLERAYQNALVLPDRPFG